MYSNQQDYTNYSKYQTGTSGAELQLPSNTTSGSSNCSIWLNNEEYHHSQADEVK